MTSNPTAVLGIDIGNHKCVLAIARDGIVDVLLDDTSSRETPSLIHFARNQRLFGSHAAASAAANPTSTISNLKRLIGRPFQHPNFQTDLSRLPYNTSPSTDGSISVDLVYLYQHHRFTSIQLLAMLLSHLKRTAEKATGSEISQCVIGIPSYFTEAQRRAYLEAAAIAKLDPLRLMHDGAAVALEYGIRRTRAEMVTSVVVFVDIGHCDTQVTVACFGCGGMLVLGHAFDRELGGRDFDEVIFDHFAELFSDQYGIDVRSNVKAGVRLRMACEKAKKVLTVNREAEIGIDCLMDGIDVQGIVTREDFEKLSSNLVSRIVDVCNNGLKCAEVDVCKVEFVELVGSGSRVPAITRELRKLFGKDPSRTLNGSECVAVGCALQGAMLNQKCSVWDYEVQDLFPFPIVFASDGFAISTIKDLLIPSTKILILPLSNMHETLKIDSTNQKDLDDVSNVEISSQKACDESTLKVQINSDLHGVVHIEIIQFSQVVTRLATSRRVPYMNVDHKEPDSHYRISSQKVRDESTLKVQIHLDLHGVVHIEIIPFSQVLTRLTTSRRVPYMNVDQKEPDSHYQDVEEKLAKKDLAYESIKNHRNSLESFIYATQKKLELSESSEEDPRLQQISAKLKEIEMWLYEDRDDELEEDYTRKMAELQELLGQDQATRQSSSSVAVENK